MQKVTLKYFLCCTAFIAIGLAFWQLPENEIKVAAPAIEGAPQQSTPGDSTAPQYCPPFLREAGFVGALSTLMHLLCSILKLPTLARWLVSILLPSVTGLGWFLCYGHPEYFPAALFFAILLICFSVGFAVVSGCFALFENWLSGTPRTTAKER